MPDPTNSQIAAAFEELGDLYELDGAIVHRVVAYRTAGKAVRDATVSVAALAREGRATELAGIGKTLEEKILALIETGDIPSATRLREKFPTGLIAVTHLPGLGPKRARRLFDELGVDSLDALRAAAEQQRIRALRGFGAKAEESILEALTAVAEGQGRVRVLLDRALAVGEAIVDGLRQHPAAERVELAGSARRMTDTVKDLDVIATAHDPAALAAALGDIELVEAVGAVSEAGARAITHTGLTVDLKVVAPDQFGNLLQHFTGSKEHNVALREDAVRRGFSVSEYGITTTETGDVFSAEDEEAVYAHLGYAYVPPELRENGGELEAARGGTLPVLVERADLRGDLHSHSTWSDGKASIEEMALAARELGHEYLAMCDHSQRLREGRLERQWAEIDALNERLAPFRILKGVEVNIRANGELDLADELLAQLDWVIASVHSSFENDPTGRVLAAMENPHVDCIGHLTGRKIGKRLPSTIAVDRVVEAALATGTFLEINSQPDRLDLRDANARLAGEAGLTLVVSSDGHSTGALGYVELGIAQARRAWLTKKQILNARPWAEIEKLRK